MAKTLQSWHTGIFKGKLMLATNDLIIVADRAKSKRGDPSYTKITVDIEKETAAKSRAICAFTEISLSDAVDEALKLWIEVKKKDGNFEI